MPFSTQFAPVFVFQQGRSPGLFSQIPLTCQDVLARHSTVSTLMAMRPQMTPRKSQWRLVAVPHIGDATCSNFLATCRVLHVKVGVGWVGPVISLCASSTGNSWWIKMRGWGEAVEMRTRGAKRERGEGERAPERTDRPERGKKKRTRDEGYRAWRLPILRWPIPVCMPTLKWASGLSGAGRNVLSV